MAFHSPGRFALALGLLASAAQASAAEPFTSKAAVVVVTGLPGDVESERSYEDQLGRLLEILSQEAARPREIFVLVDAPDRVKLPAGLAARVKAGSREAFLELARELRGRDEPLVVFAWGHGGMQGRTPVFHVRGPRLTPDDFKTLADAVDARPSRFILFFRGSGAFGAALQREGREILTSEKEVVFNSDPVGMGLLLKALREEPALTFPSLADRIGRATAAWYAGQSLARTEEPTLWTGTAPPRKLVVEPQREARAAAGVDEATSAEQRAAPTTPRAEAEQAGVIEGPSGPQPPAKREPSFEGWQGVAAVAPERFPEAAAVILRKRESFTLGESPALLHEIDQFLQVLTEEGESYGDVDIAFSPPDERVEFLDCEVRRPDGVLERLDPDAIGEAVPQPIPGSEYRMPARKMFSLPGVAPGAILRVHYRTEWKHFPLPYAILEIPTAAEIPVLDSRVEVRVSDRSAFHYAFSNGAPRPPAVERSPYGVTHSWRFDETPAIADEALAGPDRTPRLLVSTFPDWPSFSGWYRRLVQQADVVTPEIEAKAAELTRHARTEREKLIALYNFVTGLRYVAVPLGVNSHRPHAAANVLKNRYGDCKDKANLFNTLLRTQGIAADLVLVPRFTQAHDEVPGLAFNHAISRVRLGGELIWADTTDEFCRFGLLPPGDPGRKVLVVDGTTAGLTLLPAPAAAAHRIALTGTLEVRRDAPDTLAGRLEATALGFADYDLRLAAREAAGQRSTRPIFAERHRPVAGLFEMREQTATAVAALDRDFEWRASGIWSGLVSSLPGGARLVRAPFWLPAEWDDALHPRRSPLYLNRGYPLALDEDIALSLPEGAASVVLPPLREGREDPLRFRVEWSRRGGALSASLRLELKTGELDGEDTPAFQRQLRELLTALAQGASYVLEP